MRISDWSSVVCSSDLQSCYDVVVVPRSLRLFGGLDLHQVHVVDHAAVFAHVAVFGKEVVDLVRFHPLHQGIGVVSAGRLHAVQIERYRGVVASLQHGWLRSEEHTSELQSLMRNSYAVFCLTK